MRPGRYGYASLFGQGAEQRKDKNTFDIPKRFTMLEQSLRCSESSKMYKHSAPPLPSKFQFSSDLHNKTPPHFRCKQKLPWSATSDENSKIIPFLCVYYWDFEVYEQEGVSFTLELTQINTAFLL